MTVIPFADATARTAAATADAKVAALRAELVANGTLTAAGGTPASAPLPAITTTTTNATFVAGATTGTVAVLSAPPAGTVYTLLPGDGRLALNQAQTAIVVGLTASAAGTINATVQGKNASTGAVSPVLAVPVTVTAAATTPNPTPTPTPTPVNGAIIQTFGLSNWSASQSTGMARQGVAFAKGLVPAGSSIQVQRNGAVVAAQFDQRTTWSDGSLKRAVMHLRDADFASGEARTYEHRIATGVPFSNASTRTLADLSATSSAALGNYRVAFSSVTETGDAGTAAAVGGGTLLAVFAEHALRPTRVDRVASGPVGNGYRVWGMARNPSAAGAGPGVAEDAHLKVNWYVHEWLAPDGSVLGHDLAAVPAQDWCSIGNKLRRTYDADLTGGSGSASIASYAGVQHPYAGQWVTCQNAGGFNRGRRHWVGMACPTLTYRPDKSAWVASGLVPPVNLALQVNAMASGGTATYVPGATFDHRAFVDGTGAYMGRGMMPRSDFGAFLRATPEDVAIARMNSHAGLHIPYHHRSNNQRTRPGEAADTANTNVAQKLDREGGGLPAYDFTADGMPAPVLAYFERRTPGETKDGFVLPQGGSGPWQLSIEASHAVNYSYFMYLLEGEPYHLEATLDLAANLIEQGTTGDMRPNTPWEYPYPAWDAIVGMPTQERAFAFALNILGSATGAIPDSHASSRYFKRFNKQQALYIQQTLATSPADALAAGPHPFKDNTGITAPWMVAFNALGAYHNYNMTEEAGIKAWGDYTALRTIELTKNHINLTASYRAACKRKTAPHYQGGLYVPGVLQMDGFNSPGNRITITGGVIDMHLAVQDGWQLYVAAYDYAEGATNVPPELTLGQLYYSRDSSGTTCRLCTTPGGAAVAIAANYSNVQFLYERKAGEADDATPAGLATWGGNNADDSAGYHRAVMVEAYRHGAAGATLALVDRIQGYVLGIANEHDWPNWSYAVPGATPYVTPLPALVGGGGGTPTPTPTPAPTAGYTFAFLGGADAQSGPSAAFDVSNADGTVRYTPTVLPTPNWTLSVGWSKSTTTPPQPGSPAYSTAAWIAYQAGHWEANVGGYPLSGSPGTYYPWVITSDGTTYCFATHPLTVT